jgi:hypothetical protein
MLAESTELASIESKRIYSKRKITGKKKKKKKGKNFILLI